MNASENTEFRRTQRIDEPVSGMTHLKKTEKNLNISILCQAKHSDTIGVEYLLSNTNTNHQISSLYFPYRILVSQW